SRRTSPWERRSARATSSRPPATRALSRRRKARGTTRILTWRYGGVTRRSWGPGSSRSRSGRWRLRCSEPTPCRRSTTDARRVPGGGAAAQRREAARQDPLLPGQVEPGVVLVQVVLFDLLGD